MRYEDHLFDQDVYKLIRSVVIPLLKLPERRRESRASYGALLLRMAIERFPQAMLIG